MAGNNYLRKASEKITSAAADLKFKVESGATSVRDTLLDGVDSSIAAAKKTYSVVTGTIAAFTYAGVAVAMVVAPIPVMVGVAVLLFMEFSIDAEKAGIESSLKNTKKKREFERLTSLLKKHGRIPAVSLIETDFIKMEINSQAGLADGEILQGQYKSRKLSDLDDEAIQQLIQYAPPGGTAELISAYSTFQKTKGKQ
jgi:hypothetical protein